MDNQSKTASKPKWLKVRAIGSEPYLATRSVIKATGVHTVCQEAHCPNMGECWSQHTATFMIMGDSCTRACRFCTVKKSHGQLPLPDPTEPERVAEASALLNLRHVVITSVTRDDLADNGASCFAKTVKAIKTALPTCSIELLIPDLQGSTTDLKTVLDAKPDILNHNIETVNRLYPEVRPIANYQRSISLLQRSKELEPKIITKSGLMLGLGEENNEILEACNDLAEAGVEIVTLGQYLRPSTAQLPVKRYLPPSEFQEIKEAISNFGFIHVESGPLVRSSYHAKDHLSCCLRDSGPTSPQKVFNTF